MCRVSHVGIMEAATSRVQSPLLSVTEWQRVVPSAPNKQEARPSQGSAFKTHLFEDKCQAQRDYVPFLDTLVRPATRQRNDT